MHRVLIAKSEPQISLENHIRDGLRILEDLQKGFPKAKDLVETKRFWELLYTALVLHDLGKGHPEFQKILYGDDVNNWRGQRHELFSLPFVEALNSDYEDWEKLLLVRVVAGHHKTFEILLQKYIEEYEEVDFEDEFSKIYQKDVLEIASNLGKYEFSEIKAKNPKIIIKTYRKEVENVQNRMDLLMMIGAFKHCDHLASAFVERLQFIEYEHFCFLDAKVKTPYLHQSKAAESTGNIILTSPTGSGKTETALLWLKKQMQIEGQGRVFYILPFTASINAMYHRIGKSGFGEGKVGMLHGNLNAVLYEQLYEEGGNIFDLKDKIKGLKEAYKTAQTPVKVVTPFQLLKHLFGLRGFDKGIFELSGAYFIFDEIHAYDASTLAQIMVLLDYCTKELSVKVLVMTATLPTFMKKMIIEVIGPYSEIKANKALYEQFKRHKIITLDGTIENNFEKILKDVNHGKKVLIVCNTVAKAQEIFQAIDIQDKLLLHGGFNGEDRAEQEKQLKENEPLLLVGTQAIEVSLDIDYDTIYSELAPFDALLQRFGRVNRRRLREPCPCYVFDTRNEKDKFIYKDETIIVKTLEVLKDLESINNGVIDEEILQEKIDIVYPDFTVKQKEDFESIKSAFAFSISQLIPLEESKEKEEDFYKRFDGIKVLPLELKLEYTKRLEAFNFIGAELLKVQIRKNNFARWAHDQVLKKDMFAYATPNGKIIEIDFWVLYRKYDPKLGLLKDVEAEKLSFYDENIL